MPDFLFRVRTEWDATSLREYAGQVRAELSRLRQQAGAVASTGGARGGALTGAARTSFGQGQVSEFQRRQIEAQANIMSAEQFYGRESKEAVRLRQEINEALRAEGVLLRRELGLNRSPLLPTSAARNLAYSQYEIPDRRVVSGDARESERAAARARDQIINEQAAMSRLGLAEIRGENAEARAARVAVAKKRQADEQRAAQARVILANEHGELDAARDRLQAERELDRAIRRRVGQTATPVQRIQASIRQRAGDEDVDPLQFLTGRQLLTSRLLTTASFAASGALLYGGVQTIREMIDAANELDKTFNQIRRQFEAIGEGDQFEGFRNKIMDISRETGEAAKDVAFVAFQMKGAFGDTALAVNQTSDAIKIARVTGLALNEVVDSLTAAARAFGGTAPAAIGSIGDEALHVQERFGVQAKQTLQFFGDLGPVIAESGLDLKEWGAIAGAAQQASGRSGSALAEAFGRILPAISDSSAGLLQLYAQADNLKGRIPNLQEAIGTGQSGKILLEIIRDWNLFDQTQQNAIVRMIGGRREAQSLLAALSLQPRILADINDKTSNAGKTQSYFADLQDTLAQKLARARAALVEIGTALFRAGIGDVLKDLVTVGGALLVMLGQLIRAFAFINEATGGWAIRLVEIIALVKLLKVGLEAMRDLGGFTALVRAAGSRVGIGRGIGASAVADAAYIGGGNPLLAAGAGAAAREAGILGRAAQGSRFAGLYRGADSALAAAGGAGTITAVGVAAVGITYSKVRAGVEQKAKSFAEQLNKSDDATLQRIADAHTKGWDAFSVYFFGQEQPDEMARRILRQRSGAAVSQQLTAISALSGSFRRLTGAPGTGSAPQLAGVDLHGPGNDPNLLPKIGATGERGQIESAAAELEKQNDNDSQRAAGILRGVADEGLGPQHLQRIIDAVNKGEAGAAKAGQVILDIYRQRPGGDAEISTALVQANEKAIQDKANDKDYFKNVEDAVAAVNAGQLSIGKFLNDWTYILGVLKKVPDPTQEQRTVIHGIEQAVSLLQSKTAKEAADFSLQLQELSGALTPDSRTSQLTALLNNPALTNPEDRKAVLNDILQSQKALLDFRVGAERDAERQADILRQGVEIPQPARAEIVKRQIETLSPVWSALLDAWKTSLGGMAASVEKSMIDAILAGHSASAAAKAALVAQRDNLVKQIEAEKARTGDTSNATIEALGQQIVSIDKAIAAIPTDADSGIGAPDRVRATAEQQREADRKARESAQQKRELAIQIGRAQRGGRDAVDDALTQQAVAESHVAFALREFGRDSIEYKQAYLAYLQARQGVADASLEQRRAALEYQRILDEGDPIAQAQDSIGIAQQALAAARYGTAEWYNAQGQLVQAQRELQSAMFKMFEAQMGVNLAMAEAAGDQVQAAEIQIQIAQARLADAVARGDQIGALQAQASVVQAQASKTSAQISVGTRDIDFALEIGQISTSQAITQFEALLRIPGITQEQTQQILLKINALRKEASRDLQFDIPSEIKLPTLYEVRRLRQSEQAGIGYNDNRVIQVQYNVYTPMDHAATMADLAEVVGGSPRTGVQPRSYP